MPNAHNVEYEVRDDGLPHCSYCGSLDVPSTLVALVKKGTEYSGADWKYGWPHKFYLSFLNSNGDRVNCKFYADHMMEATDDQLAIWNRLAEDTVLIFFERADGKLMYRAKCNQAAGIVGGKRTIYHHPAL